MGVLLHFNVIRGKSLCKHTVIRNVCKTFTYFYWCLVYRYYSWYFGSARVSLSGWWYMLHSEVYHRYYTIPFLHGAPCVSAVCLWWQRQQCTSIWRTTVTLKCRQHHYSTNYMSTVNLFYLAGANTILSTLTTLSFTHIYRETKIKLLNRDWKWKLGSETIRTKTIL